MAKARMEKWLGADHADLLYAARLTVAAVASLLISRLLRLPESYWAAIATIIVLQPTMGAAWVTAKDRLIGTALGATAGALLATYVGQSLFVFGLGLFAVGVLCAIARIERGAYRYGGITLVIVMLIARTQPPWIVAIHRALEMSVGVAVGLAVTALWPEAEAKPKPAAA